MSLPLGWLIWGLGVLASFLAIEVYALVSHQYTLSATMRDLGHQYPLVILAFGVFWLGLGLHFWVK